MFETFWRNELNLFFKLKLSRRQVSFAVLKFKTTSGDLIYSIQIKKNCNDSLRKKIGTIINAIPLLFVRITTIYTVGA